MPIQRIHNDIAIRVGMIYIDDIYPRCIFNI